MGRGRIAAKPLSHYKGGIADFEAEYAIQLPAFFAAYLTAYVPPTGLSLFVLTDAMSSLAEAMEALGEIMEEDGDIPAEGQRHLLPAGIDWQTGCWLCLDLSQATEEDAPVALLF